MKAIIWLILKVNAIKLIWLNELLVKLKRLLPNLSLINAKLISVKLSRLVGLGTE